MLKDARNGLMIKDIPLSLEESRKQQRELMAEAERLGLISILMGHKIPNYEKFDLEVVNPEEDESRVPGILRMQLRGAPTNGTLPTMDYFDIEYSKGGRVLIIGGDDYRFGDALRQGDSNQLKEMRGIIAEAAISHRYKIDPIHRLPKVTMYDPAKF